MNNNTPLDGVIGVEEKNTHVTDGKENNTTQCAHMVGGEERTILHMYVVGVEEDNVEHLIC